uniref:Uncharacterized protein n=1 Tax=Arundo donax TaxID=35708 RepID=A0A0A9EIS6_ARUDO
METITQGCSHTGLVMHTKQQGATTYCVQGSFRSTVRLPWEPASSQPQATLAPNMISVY